MSGINGDKARFQINRKRKVLHRQRVAAMLARLGATATAPAAAAQKEPAPNTRRRSSARPQKPARD
jgi:hypothetical protein